VNPFLWVRMGLITIRVAAIVGALVALKLAGVF
jgi:hypothetical protein